MKVTALARRSGDWWAIEVPEVEGAFTQAKRLDQVPEMAADAVGLLLEVDPVTVEVSVEPHLDDAALQQYVVTTLEAQVLAIQASQRASLASRAAVDVLRSASYSTRDVAALLGVSHQRVSQIGAGAATAIVVAGAAAASAAAIRPSREILEQIERALAPVRQQLAAAMAPLRDVSESARRGAEQAAATQTEALLRAKLAVAKAAAHSDLMAAGPPTRKAVPLKRAAAKKAVPVKRAPAKKAAPELPVKKAGPKRPAKRPAVASSSSQRRRG